MLISPAYAQDAAAMGPGLLEMLLPFVLIFVVFYFLLIRPQQKRMKEHQAMLEALRRGDQVITGGGLIGTVAKVQDDELLVDIAQGVQVRVVRNTVTSVLAKPQPAKSDDKPAGGKGKSKGKPKPADEPAETREAEEGAPKSDGSPDKPAA